MNTNFKLVWFENEDTVFDSYEPDIIELIEKNVLIPEIVKYKDANYSEKDLSSADLILADYDLGTSTSVDIVKHIRGKNIVTDVLFYSSKDDMTKSIQSAVPILEGFFCAKRGTDEYLPKIELLINRVVRRSQTKENLRGMVMEYTATFDKYIFDNICNYCKDEKNSIEILNYINCTILGHYKDNTCKSCKNCLSGGGCDNLKFYSHKEIVNVTEIEKFDAETKCRILYKILKKINSSSYNSFFEEYKSEIICYRNAFAHQFSDANQIYLKPTGTYEVISDELFEKIRGYLKKYSSLFLKMNSLFATN